MAFALPHPSDPPSVWRAVTAQFAGDVQAREALMAAADAGSDAIAHSVWPALIARTKGAAHASVVRAIAARARDRRAGAGVLWALASVALGPRDELRSAATDALVRPAFAGDREGLSLAFSLSARISAARGATPRERAALEAWLRSGGEDPLAGADGASTWRAWMQGRERPIALDYALVLACAGARRAELEHLRSVAEHVIVTLFATTSPECAALWRWLATGGSDGAEDDGAGRSSWSESGPRIVALGALSTVRASMALAHLAPHAAAGTSFDRAVLTHVLRACAAEAHKAREEAHGASALSWVVLAATANERAEQQRALDAAVERLCEALSRSQLESRTLVRVLLGREEAQDKSKHALTSEPWLSPAMRVRALAVALTNEALGARSIALTELAVNGVAPGVLGILREIAKSDPDAITRQQARQLARGEAS
ncbi:MAG: hypothetical protein U0269_17315 [Polyangiales bacterium]